MSRLDSILKSSKVKLLLMFFIGATSTGIWNRYHHPIQPLYVDIYNGTSITLPEVNIQHGKINLQERIQIFQLEPGEHRIISLNHSPGPGFSVEAILADGTSYTICAGKDDALLVHVSITSAGIIPLPVR